MSKAARGVVGGRVIAVAALAAGVSWAATAPATAAGRTCPSTKSEGTVCQEFGQDLNEGLGDEVGKIFQFGGLRYASGRGSAIDPVGMAASRSLPDTPLVPLRLSTLLRSLPNWSATGTLSTLPNLPGMATDPVAIVRPRRPEPMGLHGNTTTLTGAVTNATPRLTRTTGVTTSLDLNRIPDALEQVTEFGNVLGATGGVPATQPLAPMGVTRSLSGPIAPIGK
jgi:hypothetical protein